MGQPDLPATSRTSSAKYGDRLRFPQVSSGSEEPEQAPAGTVAEYTGPAPMDLSAGKRRIWAEEGAKRFTDGRCLYCGGFNHRAAECAAKKIAQALKAAGAEVKEARAGSDSKEEGNEVVNWGKTSPQLTRKVLIQMLWNALECHDFQ